MNPTYSSLEIGDKIVKYFLRNPIDVPPYVVVRKGKIYATTNDGSQFYIKNGSIYRKGGGSYRGGDYNGYSYHKNTNDV